MIHLTLRGKVEWRLGIVGHTVLKAGIGRDIHVAGVGNLHAVNHKAILKGLKQILVQLHAPHAVAVALHSHILGQHLALQLHLLSLRRLETEDDTILGIFGRDDRTWEESGHNTRSELLLLSGLGRGWLTGSHGCFGSFLIEEQWQGLGQEILGVHPGMTELIVGKLLHTADTLGVEELHIVAGIAIQEVVGTNAQPEQANLLICILSIIVNTSNIG